MLRIGAAKRSRQCIEVAARPAVAGGGRDGVDGIADMAWAMRFLLQRAGFGGAAAFLAALALALAPQPAHANSKYAAFVVHADSGDILFSRYADSQRYPASLTKMMILYLLFEEIEAGRLTLKSELKVSSRAAGQPPSKLGVQAGTTIDVETAIQALIVKSANDVAVVVAEAIDGAEWRFAKRMTDKAQAMGMRRTTFRNASGLPNSRQVTTARDLATLSRRVVQDFPQYYDYFAAKSFSWNGRTYRTHNALVRGGGGVDGLKTGYTRLSGFNLATSATKDGQRLIGVVLGGRSSRTRDQHMREILAAGFDQIQSKPNLIAALHRNKPTPRMKPTLVAALAEASASVPSIPSATPGASAALAAEIKTASAGLGGADMDTIGALIALAEAADSDDFNEYERLRLSAVADSEASEGQGDLDDAAIETWGVQIGAYSTKALAQRELEDAAAAADMAALDRAVSPFTNDAGGTLFRARFHRLSETEAKEACERLHAARKSCMLLKGAAEQ